MSAIPLIVIGLLLLCIYVVLPIAMHIREQRAWNNGICADSGKPWVQFDTDSVGGVGYRDDSGNVLWISYLKNLPGAIR